MFVLSSSCCWQAFVHPKRAEIMQLDGQESQGMELGFQTLFPEICIHLKRVQYWAKNKTQKWELSSQENTLIFKLHSVCLPSSSPHVWIWQCPQASKQTQKNAVPVSGACISLWDAERVTGRGQAYRHTLVPPFSPWQQHQRTVEKTGGKDSILPTTYSSACRHPAHPTMSEAPFSA